MTNEAVGPHGDRPVAARERIRTCSIALSSGSSSRSNIKWSELGQALVVTEDAIIVLSPLTGLHPTLAGPSRAQDVECHPDWNGRFPHSVIQINVKTFLVDEHSERRRILLESDYSSVDPRFQNVQWTSASWSRPGMGPHGSCLILAATSELDLFVLGAPRNAWTGEWKLLHALDLNPVAELAGLDTAPLSQSAAFDTKVFTESRALLRKKQMATEVLCASFFHLEESVPSAYIVAGTRSGHLVVWNCQAATGHCTFILAAPVSSTGIEQLIVAPHPDAQDAQPRARIAFQDADGAHVCEFSPSQLSPVVSVSAHHSLISVWYWYNQWLIYSTIGKVHLYDVQSRQTTTFSLGTGSSSSYDPFSPAVSISDCSIPGYTVDVVLQDLRVYRTPSVDTSRAQSHPLILAPTFPSTLQGYPPMTEALQRKHDLHQAFLGFQPDSSSSLPSAQLVGAVRTDERVAFLGYNVSETLRYQMELNCDSSITPAAILDEALERISLVPCTPPYLVVRILLAFASTRRQSDAFRAGLLVAVEERWRASFNISTDGTTESSRLSKVLKVQRQLLYLLTCCIEPTALATLSRQHKESILRDWLAAFGQTQSNSMETEESCAACQAELTLSWDESRPDFGWAKCQQGHVWPRCSVSLATMTDREVRVCTGCWAKSLLPGKPGQSPHLTLMLEAATACLYCGSFWILR